MIPYIILFLFTLIFVFFYDFELIKSGKQECKFLLFIFTVILFGLRYRVGIDTINYMDIYHELPELHQFGELFNSAKYHSFQPLFLLLCSLAKLFTNDFWLLQVFHMLLLNVFLFYFLEKNTKYFFTAFFLSLLFYYFYFATEILRESLAVGTFLCSSKFLIEKKWIKYILCVFVASLFHFSAIVLLIFPLLHFIKGLNLQFYLLLSLFIVLSYSLQAFIMNTLSQFTDIPIILKIYGYADFAQGDNALPLKWILMKIISLTMLPLLALYILKFHMHVNLWYEKIILFHVILSIGVIFYQIIFTRFANYTQPFCVLLYTELIIRSLIYRFSCQKRCLILIVSVLILVIPTKNFFLRSTDSFLKYMRWVPYSSIFSKQIDLKREQYSFYER